MMLRPSPPRRYAAQRAHTRALVARLARRVGAADTLWSERAAALRCLGRVAARAHVGGGEGDAALGLSAVAPALSARDTTPAAAAASARPRPCPFVRILRH